MSAVITVEIDAATRAKLHGLAVPLELRDEKGQVLGHYMPTPPNGNSLSRMRVPDFLPEDLERWSREPGGRSLADILAELQGRYASP